MSCYILRRKSPVTPRVIADIMCLFLNFPPFSLDVTDENKAMIKGKKPNSKLIFFILIFKYQHA